MAACTLRIGDRVALASAGVPEVEYALFDPSEVEIVATGLGKSQEVGYQTTAGEAIVRLREAGITLPLLLATSAAMQPTLAITYARGAAVRAVATSLGPAELFEGSRYDAATKAYQGAWVDLPALAERAVTAGVSQTMQALYLLALLRELEESEPVRLVTRAAMAQARSGSRSYRRCSFAVTSALPRVLSELAADVRASPPPAATDPAEPSSAELVEALRGRVAFASSAASQDRLRAIELALALRERPLHSSLTDAEPWALDRRLSAGAHDGVAEAVDALEAARGPGPGTDYLRVRAAFVEGGQPPRKIAERVAAIALAMPAFLELQLLASEVWNAAGDPDRALLFAGDLLLHTTVDDDGRVSSLLPEAAPPPAPPSTTAEASSRIARTSDAPTMFVPPASSRAAAEGAVAFAARLESPIPSGRSAPPVSGPQRAEPASQRTPAPSSRQRATTARAIPARTRPPASSRSVTPKAFPAPEQRHPSEPTLVAVASTRDPASAPRRVAMDASSWMQGASQPPFGADSAAAHVHVPRAAPALAPDRVGRAAKSLALPDGVTGAAEPGDALPRSFLDARLQFTLRARELGRDYEARLGVTLRADLAGVEAMQRVLLERYDGRAVVAAEAAADVQRHGALLSEILARSLGAFWVDIDPPALGQWAMLVPPSTRVWPFGRLLRLIAMREEEPDLVSYFTELQRRAGR